MTGADKIIRFVKVEKLLKNLDEKNLRNETDIYYVKKLYQAIQYKKINDVWVIRCLERVLSTSFKSTRDLNKKMKKFFDRYYYKGSDLVKARKSAEMERSDLAWWLKVSEDRIFEMENNKKRLSEKAIDFIRVMGFKRFYKLGSSA